MIKLRIDHRRTLRLGATLLLLVVPMSLALLQAPAAASSGYSGTVTFALPPGEVPNYISPFVSGPNSNNQDLFQFENFLYRPLYWFGNNGEPTINYPLSIGKVPVYSNGGRTVTITMNHYTWSDGQPVTNRDIEFWMNLLVAEKENYVGYVPGNIPDDVTSMSFPAASPYQFSITFNKVYSHLWLLYTQLSEIFPIPQHSWDKTSATGAVGNYDTTEAGVKAVYAYITAQAEDEGSYTTNPLWQVVDGPFKLSAFAPSTGYAAFVPNTAYTGPQKPHIAKLEELPFTSDSAEFDALRSGEIDYGYLPSEERNQASYFTSRGYKIVKWPAFGFNDFFLNFTNPKVGVVFKQLYLRQAMQSLIDQPKIDADVFAGTAYPTYGPVPIVPKTPYLSKSAEGNPYPYSVSAAKALLTSHGWSIHVDGTDTCIRPGSASNECGAGIAKGRQLSFTEEVATGSAPFTAEVEVMQSAWSEVGIHVQLQQKPPQEIFSGLVPCTGGSGAGCSWQMANFGAPGSTPTYSPQYLPDGAMWFETGGSDNPQGYNDPKANAMIDAVETNSNPSLVGKLDAYLSKELPALWEPNYYYQVSVISSKLHGVGAQDPDLDIYPQNWTLG